MAGRWSRSTDFLSLIWSQIDVYERYPVYESPLFPHRCGDLSCPKHANSACMDMLARDYKFVLAFENSNCVDYITEKFFKALTHSVVPIVMGARKVG